MTTHDKAENLLKSKEWSANIGNDLYNKIINLLVEFKDAREVPKRYIGVICYDAEDFQEWKKTKGYKDIISDTKRKFIIDNEIYLAVYYVEHMVSYDFDGIHETRNAINNPNYDALCELVKSIMGQELKQCDSCKRFATHAYSGEYVCDYHWDKFQ